jgi:hypothetical protein
VLVIVAALLLAGGVGAEAAPRFTVIATVVSAADRKPGDLVVPVKFDARFAVPVRIDKVLSGESPWPVGSSLSLLIHSPAQTFGGANALGKAFRFTFETKPGPRAEGDCTYCLVDVKQETTTPPSRARPTGPAGETIR